MEPVDQDEFALVTTASWTSPWHAIAPTFFTVNLNSRSPPGCWSYQVRVTSSWQELPLVAPEGETPTICEAVRGLALFQVQLFDAPTSIPPVAHELEAAWCAS